MWIKLYVRKWCGIAKKIEYGEKNMNDMNMCVCAVVWNIEWKKSNRKRTNEILIKTICTLIVCQSLQLWFAMMVFFSRKKLFDGFGGMNERKIGGTSERTSGTQGLIQWSLQAYTHTHEVQNIVKRHQTHIALFFGNRDYFISNAMKYRKPNSHEHAELSSTLYLVAGKYLKELKLEMRHTST